MSQFDVAFLLLVSGVVVGWRLNVYAMIPAAILALIAVYFHGDDAGDAVALRIVHAVEGLVIFEAAYVLGAMLSEARRSLPAAPATPRDETKTPV